MTKILLISDESARHAISGMLECEDFVPIPTSHAQTGLEQAMAAQPQLVVLDLNRPGTANMDLCKQLRASRIQAPILVLSETEDELAKVLLLETGADDYVVKPFSLRELLARIRALLRRARENTPIREFADIGIAHARRMVSKRGEEVKLTRAEYNLLAYFLQHPGSLVTRGMILHSVWGYAAYPNTRTVDAHVVRLRQKLEADQRAPQHFRTVHGVGYRFVPYG
jgi:DNA-binding response OmpR family regulator